MWGGAVNRQSRYRPEALRSSWYKKLYILSLEFVQNQFGGTNPVADTILKNSGFDINTLQQTPVDFNAASLGINKFDINALQQTPVDFNSKLLGIGLDSSAAGVTTTPSIKTNISNALEFLSGILKKKAIVFMLSDFMDKDYEKTLTNVKPQS